MPPPLFVLQGNKNDAGTNGDGSTDGWLIYDEEAEFARQGVIRPKSLNS